MKKYFVPSLSCFFLYLLISPSVFAQSCNTWDDLYLSQFGCIVTADKVYKTPASVRVKIYPNTISSQRNLNKIIHIVGPYDPYGLGDQNQDNIMNKLYFLRNQGFDIAYYDFAQVNSAYLQDKSNALVSAFKRIDQLRGETKASVMIGISLGGVIARYALRTMELEKYYHGVTHYISYDSPHLGAHVPLSLQRMMEFIPKAIEAAKDDNSDFLGKLGYLINFILRPFESQGGNAERMAYQMLETLSGSPVAKQLLIQRTSSFDDRDVSAVELLNELKKLGLPKGGGIEIKNIAITRGSLNGTQLQLTSNQYFSYQSNKVEDLTLYLSPNVAGSDCVSWPSDCWIFWGRLRYPDVSNEILGDGMDNYDNSYWVRRVSAINNENYKLDIMSCSTVNLPQIIEETAKGELDKFWGNPVKPFVALQKNSCFIPTTSALNIDSLPSQTARSDLASISSFHEVFGSDFNLDHDEINIEDCSLRQYGGNKECFFTRLNAYLDYAYRAKSGWGYNNATKKFSSSIYSWTPSVEVISLSPSYNTIEVVGGVSGTRRFLSVTPDGQYTDLWGANDGTGRQNWAIELSADRTSYNIIVKGGVTGMRKYLSVNNDGTKIDLWDVDDGSGRQRWIISGENILIKGGVTGSRKYLSVSNDGKKVDLWSYDDGSGRQKWIRKPIAQ